MSQLNHDNWHVFNYSACHFQHIHQLSAIRFKFCLIVILQHSVGAPPTSSNYWFHPPDFCHVGLFAWRFFWSTASVLHYQIHSTFLLGKFPNQATFSLRHPGWLTQQTHILYHGSHSCSCKTCPTLIGWLHWLHSFWLLLGLSLCSLAGEDRQDAAGLPCCCSTTL